MNVRRSHVCRAIFFIRSCNIVGKNKQVSRTSSCHVLAFFFIHVMSPLLSCRNWGQPAWYRRPFYSLHTLHSLHTLQKHPHTICLLRCYISFSGSWSMCPIDINVYMYTPWQNALGILQFHNEKVTSTLRQEEANSCNVL